MADNALVLGQRNAEWTGHGPVLEQDIAISNIALDLIGQARNFYQYAAALINDTEPLPPDGAATEDSLAFLRDANEFRNCTLVELPRGDWALTTLRQFFFSTYQYYLFTAMAESTVQQLSAIASKSLKEVAYHLRWSAEWVIRLGDGTSVSHQRMQEALQILWPFTNELTTNSPYETALLPAFIAIDLANIKTAWLKKIKEVFSIASLCVPAEFVPSSLGKEGYHSPQLATMLADMQYLQRTHPNAVW